MESALYHGSNVVVEFPEIRASGFNKEFGFGFYCIALGKQAERWALTKKGRHIVNKYSSRLRYSRGTYGR